MTCTVGDYFTDDAAFGLVPTYDPGDSTGVQRTADLAAANLTDHNAAGGAAGACCSDYAGGPRYNQYNIDLGSAMDIAEAQVWNPIPAPNDTGTGGLEGLEVWASDDGTTYHKVTDVPDWVDHGLIYEPLAFNSYHAWGVAIPDAETNHRYWGFRWKQNFVSGFWGGYVFSELRLIKCLGAAPPPEPEPGITFTIGETDITDAFEKSIRIEKDGVGQGQFSINRHSDQATAANLAQGNVVKVTYPQISADPIFAFFLETGDFNLVSTDEEGGESLTFGGRGVRSILRRAVMWDRSYLSTTKAILGPGHRWVYTKSGSDLVSRASILFTPQAIYDVDSIETLDWPGHGDKYIGRTYGRLSSGPQSGKYVHVSWLATPYAGTGEWKLWAFGDKPGEILYRIIAEAQAASRPQHPLSALTLDFTATTDSDGNAWASSDATVGFTVQIGENLDDICQRLIDTGDIAVVCDPDLVLHAYNSYGRDLHSTTFAADKVRFAKGVNIADVLTRSRAPELPATHVLVDGDEEVTGTAELADADDRPTVEIYASLEGSSESELSDAGLALLNEGVTRLESAIFKIAIGDDPENGLYLPGPEGTDGHFWVADLVTLNTGSTDIDYVNRSETVAAITIAEDDAANLIVVPELGSVTHDARPEREVRYGRFEGFGSQSQGRGVIPGRVLTRAPSGGESAMADTVIVAADVDITAADVPYDNGTSGLTADDVQAAIDEVLASASGLVDPMTTRGDIIVRDPSNVTARLAIGAAGKILTSDGTDVSWGNGPMTTQDDLIVGGSSGAPTRLGKGSDGQVLTVDPTTHHLVWATPSSGFSNPMTTKGDLIVADTGGSAIRKAVGSDGQVLTADSASTGGVKWAAGGGGGSSDAILGQSGLGGARISGLQASADIDVGGTNDDEFNTTDTSDPMTGWTTLGSLTAHDINSTAKSHYYAKNAAAALGMNGIYKACPSMPFTMTAKFSDYVVLGGNARAQIAVLEASPGKLLTFGFAGNASTPAGLIVDLWTNRTSYASTPVGFVTEYDAHYLRAIVTSSTSIQFAFSMDGKAWWNYGGANNPGFTVGAVGIVGEGHTSGQAMEVFVDWIRFT